MADIPVPMLAVGHPDRLLHCEELLEAAFLTLVGRAGKAGWNADEVALALQSLAVNYLATLEANAETDAAKLLARNRLDH